MPFAHVGARARVVGVVWLANVSSFRGIEPGCCAFVASELCRGCLSCGQFEEIAVVRGMIKMVVESGGVGREVLDGLAAVET